MSSIRFWLKICELAGPNKSRMVGFARRKNIHEEQGGRLRLGGLDDSRLNPGFRIAWLLSYFNASI